MTDVRNWDRDANNNNLPPPDGAPEGQTAGSVNDCIRENMSGVKRLFDDTNGTRVATGASGAYAIASSQNDLTAYQDGLVFSFASNHACVGAATLDVNSIGAKAIKKFHDHDLVANDIENGQIVSVVYSASEDLFQMLSSSAMAGLDDCAIGAVTPASGSFTTLGSSGDLTCQGNIGIGKTPTYRLDATDVNTLVGRINVTAASAIQDVLSLSSEGNAGADRGCALLFETPDGGGAIQSGRISVAEQTGATDGYMAFSTKSSGTIAERVRIDRNGNVGIGTTSPANMLNVSGDGTAPGTISNCQLVTSHTDGFANAGIAIISGNSNASFLYLGDLDDADVASLSYDNSDDSMQFAVATAEAMRIDASGNVGIGLTPTSNMAGLSVEAGILTLKETTTPTADVNYGKIYTKADNKLYFQDGAGVEHEIAYV